MKHPSMYCAEYSTILSRVLHALWRWSRAAFAKLDGKKIRSFGPSILPLLIENVIPISSIHSMNAHVLVMFILRTAMDDETVSDM